MSKKSIIQRNLKRISLNKFYLDLRQQLRDKRNDKNLPIEERFQIQNQLSALPRNSARVRIRNRCKISGRGRGVYRKFNLSRIELRLLAAHGIIPGLSKASW
jgi:small subunit ribosomal protein S14